jgi:tRNA pseudouridine55 synthase
VQRNKIDLISQPHLSYQGILLVNKPRGKTSFILISALRKHLGIKKIGHTGTLDPFATGLMVLLIGRTYTRFSDKFLTEEKEYLGQIHLGITTSTYDGEGTITEQSPHIPSLQEVKLGLDKLQGEIEQIPPMFSAKKIQGKKLYELARKGYTVERKPIRVKVQVELRHYCYPNIDIRVTCSKGTYVRALAHDLGQILGCGAHLSHLERIRSGSFHIADCFDGSLLYNSAPDLGLLQQYINPSYPNGCR